MAGGQGSMPFNRAAFSSQPQTSTPFSMHIPAVMQNMPLAMPQHQQYPGINSIPGMHSMNHMSTVPGMQTMQGIHNMQSFPSMPGIPTMQSLLHPPQEQTQPISSSHLSAPFSSNGLLLGAVDKRRKHRKQRSVPYSMHSTGEDPHTMMMAAQQAAQAISHSDPTATLSHQMPVYEADGIQFKLVEQLPDAKIQRLRTEKIKAIEDLTFNDINAYNRNQLRAYCFVYGIKRKKKAEMERNMARYAAMFHPNDPAYDLNKFEPAEYANGPIPRRKVPVTKEQKEKAAGSSQRLSKALQQRPQPTPLSQNHYHTTTSSHHGALSNSHGLPQHSTSIVPPRLHELHGHNGNNMHGTNHQQTSSHAHDEHEAVVAATSDLISVPEMHVPNHLLSIPHQMGDE